MWVPKRIEQIAVGAAFHGTNLAPEAGYLRPDDIGYTTGATAFAAVAQALARPGHDSQPDPATAAHPDLVIPATATGSPITARI